MPTRPDSPDPTGTAGPSANPFAQLGADMGKGMDFFQDWMKAAGSALPHVSAASTTPGAMPGWSLPTLDPAELDKRIQELKTVQFWLEQNARMVAMSIQALEVQRMTLNTLQGMNVSMDQLKDSLKVKPDAFRDFFKAPSPPAAAADASEAAATAAAQAAAPEAPRDPEAAPAPSDFSRHSSWFQGVPNTPEAAPDESGSDDVPPPPASAPPPAADLINPLRWWDTLTQQFSHLASQAVAPTGGAKAEAPEHPLTQAGKAPGAPPARKASAARKSTQAPKAPARPSARKPAAKKAAPRSQAKARS